MCVPWNALNFAALIIRKHGSFEQIEQLTHLHLKSIEECIECLDPSRQLNRNSHAFLELSIVRSGCIKNNVTQLKSSYHNDEPNEKSSFPSTARNQNAFFHSTNDWDKSKAHQTVGNRHPHTKSLSDPNLNVNGIKNRTISMEFTTKNDVDNNHLDCYDRPLTHTK